MPRVKCPHCGAGNQDATEEDVCWQCGSVLGAPVARAPGATRSVLLEASAPTQQLDPAQMNLTTRGTRGPSQRTIALLAVGMVIILGGLTILLVLLTMSK